MIRCVPKHNSVLLGKVQDATYYVKEENYCEVIFKLLNSANKYRYFQSSS